ncbi:tetratricopeptide repeat protein, partial [bacterium]|nr:tetratricopeptide repeat protein [bacterium]
GRKAYGKAPEGVFDTKVPGTIKLEVGPSNGGKGATPPGYASVLVRNNAYATDALDDGRFTFSIPAELGKTPDGALVIEDPDGKIEAPVLSIKGDDVIHVGFPYKDEAGKEHWITRDITLTSDPFFDVMDRRYQEALEGVHVGEKVYVRVIHPSLDTTDEKDTLTVSLAAGEGKKGTLELAETFAHSGVFKGIGRITYAGEGAAAAELGDFGVAYGDTITLTYTPAEGVDPLTGKVVVFKGADGKVLPFTKRFKDPAIAVQTQFTIAEAYFELAKRHRELKKTDLSRQEIAAGKKILEEALRDFPDTEARAQAEYLLANLSLEFAEEAEDAEEKQKFHMEAASRFSDLVATYPDSAYAPKSQYKKALVFEKMGEIDLACEEYVKLSYRYPDNELVAETIARLGQYFLTKGKELKEKATPDMEPVAREKLGIESRDMFKTAAEVFGRLAVRFPDHRLAGRTSVLSAQCYMQAEDQAKAVETFQKVIETPNLDPDIASEAMYWCGDAHMRQDEYVDAYRMFKRLTWDYPASKWAKFARGRLTDENLVGVGEKEDE